jgi:hypothetical protein
LRYVTDELKADKDVVLKAVTSNSFALQYGTYELRSEKEIVLAAVLQDWDAFQYARVMIFDPIFPIYLCF